MDRQQPQNQPPSQNQANIKGLRRLTQPTNHSREAKQQLLQSAGCCVVQCIDGWSVWGPSLNPVSTHTHTHTPAEGGNKGGPASQCTTTRNPTRNTCPSGHLHVTARQLLWNRRCHKHPRWKQYRWECKRGKQRRSSFLNTRPNSASAPEAVHHPSNVDIYMHVHTHTHTPMHMLYYCYTKLNNIYKINIILKNVQIKNINGPLKCIFFNSRFNVSWVF